MRSGALTNQIGYTVNGHLNNDIAVSGADFTGAAASTVTFAAGNLRQSVTVSVANDALAEATEKFLGKLSNGTGVSIIGGAAEATIVDGTAAKPTLVVGRSYALETDGHAVFRVSLSKAAGGVVSADLATAAVNATAETDYGAGIQVSDDGLTGWTTATALSFAAGQTQKFVRVAVTPDNGTGPDGKPTNVEGNERFTLTATVTAGASLIANAADATSGAVSAAGIGTIVDASVGTTPLAWIDSVTLDEASGQAVFSIARSSTTLPVGLFSASVQFSTADRMALTIDVAATVDAGDGDDTVYASNLGDNVFGGAGNDTLYGGRLDDWLLGGDGNDTLNAGTKASGTLGGDGNYLNGGAGDDLLIGREGSDWLEGGDGADKLEGGDGGDILAGGGGAGDVMHGGRGDDQYIFRLGDATDDVRDESGISLNEVVEQAFDGNTSWNDEAESGELFSNLAYRGLNNWRGGGIQVGRGSMSTGGVAAGGEDALVFGVGIGLEDIAIAKSGDGKDLIITLKPKGVASGDVVTLIDWFNAFNKIEILRFADGNEVRIADFDVFISGTDGPEVIIGTVGNDFVHAGAGDDVVYLLAGNDFGNGGLGNDAVSGDSGNDIVMGADGDDRVHGGSGTDSVSGGRGNDYVTGDEGNDIVAGGQGNDEVIGGSGNDVFKFQRGDGVDTLIDQLTDTWRTVWISGQGTVIDSTNAAISYFVDSTGSLIQRQTGQTDIKIYDAATNTWSMRTRYDVETGTLKVHKPSGATIVSDTNTSDVDVLEFGIGIDINDIQFQISGSDLVVGIEPSSALASSTAGLTDRIVLKEWVTNTAATGSIEKFVFFNTGAVDISNNVTTGYVLKGGTDANDSGPTVTGTTGRKNWITGGAGDDTLTGADKDDILSGNSGQDTLVGGAGADILLGGIENDTLTGGAGADMLIGGDGEDIAAYDSAVTVFLGGDGTNTGDAAGDSFDSVEGLRGSSGADTLHGDYVDNDLRGGGGNDRLEGKTGNDYYTFTRGDGSDIIKDVGSAGEIVVVDDNGVLQPPYIATVQLVDREGANYQFEQIITNSDTNEIVYRREFNNPVTAGLHGIAEPTAFDDSNWGSGYTPVAGPLPKVTIPVAASGGDDTIFFEDATAPGALPTADQTIGLSDLTFSWVNTTSLKIQLNATVNGTAVANGDIVIENFRNADGTLNPNHAIEFLQFSDGSSIRLADLRINASSNDTPANPVEDFIYVTTAGTYSGGSGNDALLGSAGVDTLNGDEGDDFLVGGLGNDALHGGVGIDTVSYLGSDGTTADRTIGVTVNLATGQGGGIGTEAAVSSTVFDTYSGIENVIGSQFNDAITGDAGDNVLKGNRGNDTITGGGGDYLSLTDPAFGVGNDVLLGDDGNDTLRGGVGEDNLEGGAGNDILEGGSERDVLSGGDGDDIVRGDSTTTTAAGTIESGDYTSAGSGPNVLVNGSFEDAGDAANDVVQPYGLTTPDLPGWTIASSGTVPPAQLLTAASGVTAQTGARALHLDTGVAGVQFKQELTTLKAGETLLLNYSAAVRSATATGGFEILWNGAVVRTVANSTSTILAAAPFLSLTAQKGTNTLAFRATGTVDGQGSVIDNVRLTRGDDVLIGGAGRDRLVGGGGTDIMLGGDGDDSGTNIAAGAGTQQNFAPGLFGGAGDDILDGGTGNDALDGGTGNDSYLFRAGSGNDTVTTSGGLDDLIFDEISHNQLWLRRVDTAGAASETGNDLQIVAVGLGSVVTVKNWYLTTAPTPARRIIASDRILAASDVEALRLAMKVIAPTTAPTSWPSPQSQALADALTAAWQDSANYVDRAVINGTTNHDDGTGTNPPALVANPVLIGGVAFDPKNGNDTIVGGIYDDEFRFGAYTGNKTINGGEGTDRIIATVNSATINLASNGLTSVEKIDGNGKTGVNVNVVSGGTIDLTNIEVTGIAAINGQAGNETITGSAGDDVIIGGDGVDILKGGLGNDRIQGGVGSDNHDGGDGIDTIDQSFVTTSNAAAQQEIDLALGRLKVGSTTTIYETAVNFENAIGGSGADKIFGNSGANVLEGRGGVDEIKGAAGDDILIGGAGGDTLVGGDGLDTASYANAAVSTSTLTESHGGVSITFNGVNANLLTNTGTGTEASPVAPAAKATLGDAAGDWYHGIENLTGSSFKDKLTGNTAANVLSGGDGDDVLLGGGGNDTLEGGAGNDFLDGGNFVNTTNTAVFAGKVSEYIINTTGTYVTVTGIGARAGDGVDKLVNIQRITFADLPAATPYISLGENANNAPILGQPYMADQNALDGVAFTYTIPLSSFIDLDIGSGIDAMVLSVALADGSPWPGWLNFNPATRTFSGTVPARTETDPGEVGKTYEIVVTASDSGSSVSDTFLLSIGEAPGANVPGTTGNDTLLGTNHFRAQMVTGLAGDDILLGSYGADTLDGGTGTDLADYSASPFAIDVDLKSGKGVGGHADGDTLIAIEKVKGSAHGDTITGSLGQDDLRGGDGDDTIIGGDLTSALDLSDLIDGGAGSDRLYGGTGVDTIYSRFNAQGQLEDFVDGGAGLDELHLEGSVSLGIGGSANGGTVDLEAADGNPVSIENVVGSDYADTISGNGYSNILKGGLGNDTLFGGKGNDTLEGGAGDDTLAGGIGEDWLDGGTGSDTASYYQSTLNGAIETQGVIVDLTDEVNNTGRADGDHFVSIENLKGTFGSDTLRGDGAGNILQGMEGADTLKGEGGADVLEGGAGDDHLWGGTDNDLLKGGAGTDRAYFAGNFAEYTINYSNRTVTHLNIQGQDTYEDVEFLHFGDGTVVDVRNLAPVTGTPGLVDRGFVNNATDTYVIPTTAFNDPDGNQALPYKGLSFSATLVGGGALPGWLTFDPAAKTFTYNANIATVGTSITVRVTATDPLLASVYADFVVYVTQGGTAGNDVLIGTFRPEVFNGLGGNDAVMYSSSTAGVTVNLLTGAASGGFAEGDAVFNVEELFGSEFADSLTGTSGVNTLGGEGGNDTLIAGDGNDVLSGGDGDDVLYGDAGDDNLLGGAGADQLIGGAGVDYANYYYLDWAGAHPRINPAGVRADLLNSASNLGIAFGDTYSGIEHLYGSAFDDWLGGDHGGNILEGNEGSDTIEGRDGADTLSGMSGNDYLDGGDGNDQLFGGSDNDTIIGRAGTDTLYGDAGNDALFGGNDADTLSGGDGDDQLYGENGADAVSGGLGNDMIFMTALDGDTIDGGAGSDTVSFAGGVNGVTVDLAATGWISVENLTGGSGADTLLGNALANVLDGGGGIDTLSYEYSAIGSGFSTPTAIGGSVVGAVTIALAEVRALDGVNVDIAGNTASGAGAQGDVISNFENLTGSAHSDLLRGSNASSTVVRGLAGHDVIYGGAYNDQLYGGDGNDFIFGGAGIDSIYGDAGNDRLFGDGDGDFLYGGANDDILDAGDAGDVLVGGTGNDILVGGLGADQYIIQRNSGSDTIYNFDGDSSADSLQFDQADNIQHTELWFSKSGKDLLVKILGTTNPPTVTTIKDWFTTATAGDWTSDSNFYVDVIIAGNRVNRPVNLISLLTTMSAFTTEPASFSQLSPTVQAQIDNAWGYNDLPTIAAVAGNPTTVNEDGSINLRFTVADTETTALGISLIAHTVGGLQQIIPASDIRIIDANTREVTVRPLPGQFGSGDLIVRAFDGALKSTKLIIPIAVAPVADGLALGAATTSFAVNAGSSVALTGLSAGLVDTDGSEVLDYLFLDGLAVGAVLSSGANSFTASAGNTSANITGWNLATLSVTAPAGTSADMTLRLRGRSRDGLAGGYVYSSDTLGAAITVAVNGPPATPTVLTNGPSSVSENVGATHVVTLNRIDPDGTTPSLILQGADAAYFTIVGGNQIWTIANLDFEAKPSLSLEVAAFDGTFTSAAFTRTVAIANANDAPVISSNGGGTTASISIVENTATVTDVDSTDQDVGATATYSISGGADMGLFTINASSGLLSFLTAPSYEARPGGVYLVTVRVSDGTATDTQDLTVTVTDANDAPVITSNAGGATATITLAENQTSVTDVDATDQDGPTTDLTWRTIVYSIVGGADQGKFNINSSTGVLTFANAPNFEAPTDSDNNNSYIVVVRASTGAVFDDQTLTVNVGNANEDPYNIRDIMAAGGSGTTGVVGVLDDGTAGGPNFAIRIQADDYDANTTLTYSLGSLAPAFAGKFVIDSSTGVITVASGQTIEFEATLGTGLIAIPVAVSDGIVTVQSNAFSVQVVDKNEAPRFTSSSSVTVDENITGNSAAYLIATLLTEDDDLPSVAFGRAGQLVSIVGGSTVFEIRRNGVTLNYELWTKAGTILDYEAQQSHTLNLRVYDNYGNADFRENFQVFTVNIGPLNESPIITSNGGGASASISIAENTTAVTTVTSTDPENNPRTYQIASGLDAARFLIDANTGVLTFLTAPNFEEPTDSNADNIYHVTVRATDGSMFRDQALTVTVTNSNDSAPNAPTVSAWGQTSFTETVNVGGTVIATFSAPTDPDGALNALNYVLTAGDATKFEIVGNQLRLKAGVVFDYDAATGGAPSYGITIQAYDGVNYSSGWGTTVTITAQDDNLPTAGGIAMQNGFSTTIAENSASVGTVIAQVSSADYDGDLLVWSIVGGNATNALGVNASGQLFINAGFNYEALGGAANLGVDPAIAFSITVRAAQANDPGRYVDQTLNLSIADVSEAQVIYDSTASYTQIYNYQLGLNFDRIYSLGGGILYQHSYRFNFSSGTESTSKIIFIDNDGNGRLNMPDTYLFDTTNGVPNIQAPGYYWTGGYFSSEYMKLLPPVVFDLDGDGVVASTVTTNFDIDGDGGKDTTGWIGSGDGFLALDRNNNGLIDNGAEISFMQDKPGATTDLEGLSAYDSNNDGVFDTRDLRFGEFLVWQDANSDGISDAGELRSLAEAGIVSISLAIVKSTPSDEGGVAILGHSSFTRSDGSTGLVGDVALRWDSQKLHTEITATASTLPAQQLPAGGRLALDEDGNGAIEPVSESYTLETAMGLFDSDGDARITPADARYVDLRLWTDNNRNGRAELVELDPLGAVGLTSLGLAANDGGDDGGDTGGDPAIPPKIAFAAQSFGYKAKKFYLQTSGGALFVRFRGSDAVIDPRAGSIGGATILSFKDKAIGILSPIVLDLDGDGITLKNRTKSKAKFDMDGDGRADDTGWVGKKDGMLVIDRNGDGAITSGSELSFLTDKPDAKSDLEALRSFDSNGDGKLDKDDARWGEFKVWVDANDNGVSNPGELKTLEQLGITEIGLTGRATEQTVKADQNAVLATATFKRADGSVGTLGDVALAFDPSSAKKRPAGSRVTGEPLGGGRGGRPDRVSENPGVDDAALLLGMQDMQLLNMRKMVEQVPAEDAMLPGQGQGDLSLAGTDGNQVLAQMIQSMASFGATGSSSDLLKRQVSIDSGVDWMTVSAA